MEVLTSDCKITLKHIFLDNGNWWKFFLKYRHIIRLAIITNVLKMLVCRTPTLGYRLFHCTVCSFKKIFCFSCKSRFCASCGKKATDIWMQNAYNRLPKTRWQHITFTMPDLLWDIFWHNRHLINKVAPIAANIIKTQAKKQRFIPGIYLAIHTFGRDLKRNLHIHLSTTAAGLSFDHKRWILNTKRNGSFILTSNQTIIKTILNIWANTSKDRPLVKPGSRPTMAKKSPTNI